MNFGISPLNVCQNVNFRVYVYELSASRRVLIFDQIFLHKLPDYRPFVSLVYRIVKG